ncbi:hypothetical protein BGW80DRAFT_1254060 [Lactifluus volemus]|nr:hypothetical protein BGW80DRAFT_1254060 [Lactifluus volemus]
MDYSRIQQANGPLEHEIAPSPRSIPRTLHGHVQENLRIQPAAANNQFEGVLVNIPPPASGVVAMQGYPQDPLYIDEAHYDISVGHYPRPQPGGLLPQDPAISYVYHNALAGVAQDIQMQPQAIQVQVAPEFRGNNDFGSVPQHLAPGPAPAQFPDPWAHHAPVRDYPQAPVDSADHLGRLARRYIDHPDSQVMQVDRVVRMELGHARRFKVPLSTMLHFLPSTGPVIALDPGLVEGRVLPQGCAVVVIYETALSQRRVTDNVRYASHGVIPPAVPNPYSSGTSVRCILLHQTWNASPPY